MPDSQDHSSSDSYEFYDDPLYLSSSDQPTSLLTPVLFDGTDFLSWKQDVLMALAAKNKDGFINGSLVKPSATDKKYHQFIRCDLMVLKWILNSTDKSIRETLKYIRTAKALWDEIMERYGQTNFIEIYQLNQDLSSVSQANSSLIEYYSKVKQIWETLDSLDPIPDCSCGKLAACTCTLLKRMQARDQQAKLIRFLMGLNSGYDTVRTQILSMDPLPSISKVLGLLQKVEKHKQLTEIVEHVTDITAYASYKSSDASTLIKKPGSQTGSASAKYCSRCEMNNHSLEECFMVNPCPSCGKVGHSVNKCFHIVGFPGKNNKGKGKMAYNKNAKQSFKKTANNADMVIESSPLDDDTDVAAASSSQSASFDSTVIDGLVTSVIDQVLKRISDSKTGLSTSNFAGISHHAFTAHQHNAHIAQSSNYFTDWIIDTGASDHMTYNIDLLHNKVTLNPPMLIGLPDGTHKSVSISGDVLTPEITLKHVLLLTDFKQNLLSVSKLIDNNNLSAIFLSEHCLFQDIYPLKEHAANHQRTTLDYITDETKPTNKWKTPEIRDGKTILTKRETFIE
ncbi:uncharacterized protein LOC141612606 [Silene latifolia]|uniref:uncharacterized protein LOC141612606 n=1 Tax=Silene latifolia TaxID=37657 RepID=UPI003D772887